jgi:hypothetical protein
MIKCRIYKGDIFEENGKIKFLRNGTVDKGYEDYFNEKDFKLQIQAMALQLGMYIDAYDEKGNIFWSNYQDVQESGSDKETLIEEYEQLSGEKAKGTWGVKKLTEEINKLKQ